MTISEAARLVIQAGAIGEDGQILLLDMGQPVRIIDLAADMIRLSGLRVGSDIGIEIVGLRPGEKMFEELHADDEQRLPTSHPKIIVAQRRQAQNAELPLEHLGIGTPRPDRSPENIRPIAKNCSRISYVNVNPAIWTAARRYAGTPDCRLNYPRCHESTRTIYRHSLPYASRFGRRSGRLGGIA